MRPQSFQPQMPQMPQMPRMPQGRPFNNFPDPMQNFGFQQPSQFPQGMGPGIMQGIAQGMSQGMSRGMSPSMLQGMPQGMPQGGLPTGSSSPRLNSFMETANRFLSTAQSFQPLIQQATPMFQNLPALWKLYKGFQGLPKSQSKEEASPRKERTKTSQSVKTTERERPEPITTRPSVPRIYQPPYNFE